MTLELGGESPLSLLSSNLASMGHFDIVGDKLGYGCVGVELWLEIGDVVFEGDVGVECKWDDIDTDSWVVLGDFGMS